LDFTLGRDGEAFLLTLVSSDGMNRLTRKKVVALTGVLHNLASQQALVLPLIISGEGNFSAGADLNEITALTGPEAYPFSKMGQDLMNAVANYPAPVIAAIKGHCMGGGLDLALACHHRIAAPNAIFGHRGAALGLITGWGGTQRLPRLVGKGRALELLVAADKLDTPRALAIGLVDSIANDPVAQALRQLHS
jgi:enoyl-CoA hydratase/carnithine racemase